MSRSGSFRLNRRVGQTTDLIYPFDDAYFSAYGDFLDIIDDIATQFDLTDHKRAELHHMFPPSILVEIMVHEEIGDNHFADGFIDLLEHTLYGDVVVAVRHALAHFIETAPKPYGFEELCQVVAQCHQLSILSLEGLREQDAQIYTLVPMTDDDC